MIRGLVSWPVRQPTAAAVLIVLFLIGVPIGMAIAGPRSGPPAVTPARPAAACVPAPPTPARTGIVQPAVLIEGGAR